MIRVIDKHHLQVGDRTWWGEYSTAGSLSSESEAVARISHDLGWTLQYERRQFTVHFESGWMVSVIWGSMTYSDNHDHGMPHAGEQELIETPERVEIGILHKDRDGVQGGDVMGYMDEDDVNFTLDLTAQAGTTDHLILAGHIALFLGHQGDLPSGE